MVRRLSSIVHLTLVAILLAVSLARCGSSPNVLAVPGWNISTEARTYTHSDLYDLVDGQAESFFVYGFAKSDKDNLQRDELKAFRRLARELLPLDDDALAAAMNNATIMEIKYNA